MDCKQIRKICGLVFHEKYCVEIPSRSKPVVQCLLNQANMTIELKLLIQIFRKHIFRAL